MKYRKHFEKKLHITFDNGNVILQNVFCDGIFINLQINLNRLISVQIITEHIKVLSVPVNHTAWLFDFEGSQIVISPEARKECGDLKDVSPFKTYEFAYFAYCLEDFRKIKKDFGVHNLNIDKTVTQRLFLQIAKDVNNKNSKNENYSLLYNNCAINMLKSVKSILNNRFNIFDLPYFYLTQFLPKRINGLLKDITTQSL